MNKSIKNNGEKGDNRKKIIIEHIDAIIDSLFDGIWIMDKGGMVLRINKASEKINSISEDQVIYKSINDLVEEGKLINPTTPDVLKRKVPVSKLIELKNGRQCLATGNPVFDEEGEIGLVVVIERDMTELNRLRSDLEKTRALSEEYRIELSMFRDPKSLLSDVIIRSSLMKRVLNTALKVALVDSTVLIYGESGVGKGLFATLIHKASKRKEGPFIRVDCSAIPQSLIESELFGYEKGAFTDARKKGKPGLFEMAEGGTLFLDEIGELSLNIQVKLLRFIESNEVVRIGGTQSKKIDTRIITATNRNLETMVKDGQYRRDLFYRLSVVPINIPPLRERSEDIPPLVNFFLEKFKRKCSIDRVILPNALDCICGYSFPGNIRELANLIEQLVVLSPHKHISIEDLPSQVRTNFPISNETLTYDKWDIRKAVKNLEKEIIIRAIKRFGSQKRVADHLKINQSTVARKIKRYNIKIDALLHDNS